MGQAEVLEILKKRKGEKFTVKQIREIYLAEHGEIGIKNTGSSCYKLFKSTFIKRVLERSIKFVGVNYLYWYEEGKHEDIFY